MLKLWSNRFAVTMHTIAVFGLSKLMQPRKSSAPENSCACSNVMVSVSSLSLIWLVSMRAKRKMHNLEVLNNFGKIDWVSIYKLFAFVWSYSFHFHFVNYERTLSTSNIRECLSNKLLRGKNRFLLATSKIS